MHYLSTKNSSAPDMSEVVVSLLMAAARERRSKSMLHPARGVEELLKAACSCWRHALTRRLERVDGWSSQQRPATVVGTT